MKASVSPGIINKVLTSLIPLTFTGLVFMIGFVATIKKDIAYLKSEKLELKEEILLIKATRYTSRDAEQDMKPVEIRLGNIEGAIVEIKGFIRDIEKKN